MKKVLALLFFLACGVFLIWETHRVVMSWLAPLLDADTLHLKGSDPKLFLVWAVLALLLVSWFIWPSLWRAKSDRAPDMNGRQILSAAFAISGLLALFKIVFSDGYLSTARGFGEERGYVVCDETRYKYFRELQMARQADHCPKN